MVLMEVIFANVHSQENGSSHGPVAVNCTRPDRGECALYEQTVTGCTADPRFFFAGNLDQESKSTILAAVSSAPETNSGGAPKKKKSSVCVLLA